MVSLCIIVTMLVSMLPIYAGAEEYVEISKPAYGDEVRETGYDDNWGIENVRFDEPEADVEDNAKNNIELMAVTAEGECGDNLTWTLE